MDFHGVAENASFSSSTSVKIGILGGIGPEATGEFYSKLIKELQKRKLIERNIDFPHIVINSIPASELVFDKIPDNDLKPYIEGLQFLDKSGADFILNAPETAAFRRHVLEAHSGSHVQNKPTPLGVGISEHVIVMVCNTIHLYYDRLQKEIKTPLLDLREEVKKVLAKKGKRVLVLGTPATIKHGLYKFPGIKYSTLTKKEMNDISVSILRFNRGIGSRSPANICKRHTKNGSQIVLACTELSLMLEKENIPNINTVDVLVDATVNKFLYYRLQKNNKQRGRLKSRT